MIQHHFFSPIPQTLQSFHRFSLPKEYLSFLKENGAGYLKKTKIKTSEPTRFGLEYALCNGICGFTSGPYFPSILCQEWEYTETGLPEYLVIFFQDGPIYYCFDYQQSSQTEPSIRFVDTEMDQWMTIADNFSDFLNRLEMTMEEVNYDSKNWMTLHTLNQQIGQENLQQIDTLLEIAQEVYPQLYLQWTLSILETSQNAALIDICQERFLFVQTYLAMEFNSYPEFEQCCQYVRKN